jgi:hypothetical protein
VINVRTKLAISIGAVVVVLVIVFCILPLKEVSYEGIGKYMATGGYYYVDEPYAERMPYNVSETRSIQVPYTVEEAYTVWQIVRDPITNEVLGREPVTRYRTVLKHRPATAYGSATSYREVTLHQDAAGQTYAWQERTVTLYKKVSFLEAAIAY